MLRGHNKKNTAQLTLKGETSQTTWKPDRVQVCRHETPTLQQGMWGFSLQREAAACGMGTALKRNNTREKATTKRGGLFEWTCNCMQDLISDINKRSDPRSNTDCAREVRLQPRSSTEADPAPITPHLKVRRSFKGMSSLENTTDAHLH